MKRAALLAAVVFPVVVLFYALHGSSKASTPKPSERDQPPVATTTVTTAPATPSLSAPAPATPVVEAYGEGLLPVLQPGHAAVEQAAKKCWHDRNRPPSPATRPNGPDETIETIQLTYRLISDQGVGRVEEVKIGHDQFTDQALQSCILKAAAAVTWKSSAPDGLLGIVEHNVNIGDLMRPPPSLPPPSSAPATAEAEETKVMSVTFDPKPAEQPKK